MVHFFQLVQITSGALLVLLILLHSPKGDGLASIGGSSQLFSSQKGVEAGLNKLTMWIAIIFGVVSLLLGFNIIR
ncbi:MAG: preprotein translocase subunit SecG [Candidatus Gastranaerophilales bacterium]|nr:preprotein translocase subunit SecG [Candidatus Gastranaerophilales bacterium]